MPISREFYRELESLREAAANATPDDIELMSEDIALMVESEAGTSLDVKDVSIRRLFEATVEDGHLRLADMDPSYRGMSRYREATDAVSTSMFAHTMGQIIYTATLKAYQMPELIGDRLVTVMPSDILTSEKVPGVTEIGDQVEIVNEGQPYPRALVGESFIETPDKIKRGLIVDVTKEAIFGDRTGLILGRALGNGKSIAINREKRILDVCLGITTTYRRNGSAAAATYQSDNTVTGTALIDWTDIDAADTKFSGITDPDTGEPIVITANVAVVPPALKNTANRIINATMTNQTTGSNETRLAGPSLNQTFAVESNQYVKQRTSSDSTWFYGNFVEAFLYLENFPLTVETNGAGSEASFERDIVAQSKASERGCAAVRERLYALKATA